MSKAKFQAAQAGQQQSSGSFAAGFLLGQLTLALILFCFIKFFIFGDAPSSDVRAATRAATRRQRTLSHTHRRQRTLSSPLTPRQASSVVKQRADGGPTAQKILEQTYYQVHGHQPESLDWFNVLVAQTIAQLRADAAEDEALLSSLTDVINGASKPDFIDDIKVTEISLGDEFPIFSNCRIIPVDEHGSPIKELKGNRGEMLQARMDLDLSDVVTLGVETKLVVNYPKPSVLVLPVALAVSVVRFSGTLAVSFASSALPHQQSQNGQGPNAFSSSGPAPKNEGHPLNPTGKLPTTLTFAFLDDYRLDLSVHSLIGSRSKLQDVPKIAQLVEDRIHRWFDDRCVEPRFQQIVLPSFWPRRKTTRVGVGPSVDDEATFGAVDDPNAHADPFIDSQERDDDTAEAISQVKANLEDKAATTTSNATATQRTRDWAASQQHPKASLSSMSRDEPLSELELAGREMREADERERERRRQQQQQNQPPRNVRPDRETDNMRLRASWDSSGAMKIS